MNLMQQEIRVPKREFPRPADRDIARLKRALHGNGAVSRALRLLAKYSRLITSELSEEDFRLGMALSIAITDDRQRRESKP
jgi:hypothetical protein